MNGLSWISSRAKPIRSGNLPRCPASLVNWFSLPQRSMLEILFWMSLVDQASRRAIWPKSLGTLQFKLSTQE